MFQSFNCFISISEQYKDEINNLDKVVRNGILWKILLMRYYKRKLFLLDGGLK